MYSPPYNDAWSTRRRREDGMRDHVAMQVALLNGATENEERTGAKIVELRKKETLQPRYCS